MAALKVRRIDLTAGDAAKQLAKLRDQFRFDSEIVTPVARKLTQSVFGEPLTPAQAVERICADVRADGLPAVLRYTEAFDKVKLKPTEVRVKPAELAAAHAAADPRLLETVQRIRYNIDQFQSGLL